MRLKVEEIFWRVNIMKRTVLDPRSLILAPVVLLIGYLISLPVYYFGLVWHDGLYAFYVENIYISVFGLIGFFGFRWLDRICKDRGAGNLYLCSTLLILFVILFCFQGEMVYAVNIARLLYPGGLKYKSALSFDDGLTLENLVDLMQFSSIYICTYAASCFLMLAMFCRVLLNEYVSTSIEKLRFWHQKRVDRKLYGKDGDGEEDPFQDEDDFGFEDDEDDMDLNDIVDKDFEEMMDEDMEAAENKSGVIRCVGEIRGRRPSEDDGEKLRGDHTEAENGAEAGFEESAEADRHVE